MVARIAPAVPPRQEWRRRGHMLMRGPGDSPRGSPTYDLDTWLDRHTPTPPFSLDDIRERVARLQAESLALIEQAEEAIRQTRATIAWCRARRLLARPGPTRRRTTPRNEASRGRSAPGSSARAVAGHARAATIGRSGTTAFGRPTHPTGVSLQPPELRINRAGFRSKPCSLAPVSELLSTPAGVKVHADSGARCPWRVTLPVFAGRSSLARRSHRRGSVTNPAGSDRRTQAPARPPDARPSAVTA